MAHEQDHEGEGVTTKARIDMKIDTDLKAWVKQYAHRKGTTVTDLVKNYFIFLREKEEEAQRLDSVEQI